MLGYCVKCKCKQNMTNQETVILKNKRPAMKGVCAVCATKMMVFVKKS